MKKTIVITGCSSGFGRDLAERLARDGHRVAATMRDPDGKNAEAAGGLKALADTEGLDLRVLDLDVTSDASVANAANGLLYEWGAPDAVVNNAGQMFGGITEAFSDDEFTRQLDINVVGVHRVSRAFLPAMRERGSGLVMNLSSTAGRCVLPFFGVYHASKWALEGYTAALRLELAQTGVDAVIVEPGPCSTNLFSGMTAPADADGCAASYPPAVSGAFEAMGADFQAMLASPETPTDPALVVEAMTELLAMRPGTRPLRTVVGMDFGVRDRNADDERHDTALFEAFDLTEFATLAVSTPGANGQDDGRVTFEFEQAATGPGTFAGTFEASGAISDTGTTEDALDVSSEECANPLVATFRRTVTGEKGTIILTGDATVDLGDPASADVVGTWQVESGTGAYADHAGSGEVSGTADFTLEQPRGTLRYDGHLRADG
jgi:NAD(P)-dependent dehydrogenase (short-subunit alcohol dehydrogenase family)